MYTRFYLEIGNSTNRLLSTPDMVDSHFRPVDHPKFGPCFNMEWGPEMLNAGIYYTRIVLYDLNEYFHPGEQQF